MLQSIKDQDRTRPVTIAELAAVTELSPSTIRRDIAAGLLTAHRRLKRGSSRLLVPVEVARQYLRDLGHNIQPAA